MKYSLTHGGILTTVFGKVMEYLTPDVASELIVKLLGMINITASNDEATTVVSSVIMTVGVIMAWIGRARLGDVNLAGFRVVSRKG